MNLAVDYHLRIRSDYQAGSASLPIDRLTGTGQSRHQVDARMNLSKGAFAIDLNSDWRSTTRIADQDSPLTVRPPLIVDLGFSVDVDRLRADLRSSGWRRRLRITLNVQNLSDDYRRVTRPDGSVPPGYSAAEADPLGRTVQLAVRKQF